MLVTFLHCFQVHPLLYYFFFSHWWPILIIVLFRHLHIFCSLSKWDYTTFFFCLNVTQVLCKDISIGSKWIFSRNWSHLLCLTLTEAFILSIWVIFDPFLFLSSVDNAYFFSLCKWTLHLTAFRSFSDIFLLLHWLNWNIKERLFFSFWVPVMQCFTFWIV